MYNLVCVCVCVCAWVYMQWSELRSQQWVTFLKYCSYCFRQGLSLAWCLPCRQDWLTSKRPVSTSWDWNCIHAPSRLTFYVNSGNQAQIFKLATTLSTKSTPQPKVYVLNVHWYNHLCLNVLMYKARRLWDFFSFISRVVLCGVLYWFCFGKWHFLLQVGWGACSQETFPSFLHWS